MDRKKLGPYEIVQEIGQGGMGKVYKAYHPQLERTVAIKVMLLKSSEREHIRFLSEAKLTANLKHPNIVTVYDVAKDGDIDYIVMDYIQGLPLSAVIKKHKLSPRKALEIIRDVALAIQYAHENGIIHRDLKPENIMIETSGRPVVMDFGLAKNVKADRKLTKSGEVFGSLHYMAPEQAEGRGKEVSPRTDVYGLGAILYEMLTGYTTVSGVSTLTILYNVVNLDVIPPRRRNPNLAVELDAICMKALEKKPAMRYQSAKEFAEDIERFLNGETVLAKPMTGWSSAWKKIRRNKVPLSLITVFVLLLACILGYFFYLLPGTMTIETRAKIAGIWKQVLPEIWLDGKKLTTKPVSLTMLPGNHKVRIGMAGYEPQEVEVSISAGQEIKLEKQLMRKRGHITIQCPIAEVEASLRNINTGDIYNFLVPVQEYSLDVGEYEAVFRKENHFPEIQRLKVEEEKLEITAYPDPMLLWSREIEEDQPITNMALMDMDGNGEMEYVYFTGSGGIVACNFRNHRRLWSAQNQMSSMDYQPAFHDFNRDGFVDFVLPHHEGFLAIDGKTRQEFFHRPQFWGKLFLIADANQDGYDDYILFRAYYPSENNRVECSDFKTGKVLWEKRIDMGRPASWTPNMLDSTHALVATSKGTFVQLDITNGNMTHFFDYEGSEPDDIQIVALPGDKKLLLWHQSDKGLNCMSLPSREMAWQWPHTSRVKSMLILDIQGDKRQEVLLQMDRVYCLDLETGKEVWQSEIKTKASPCMSVVADLDKDMIPEVIVHIPQEKIAFLNGHTGKLIGEYMFKGDIKTFMPVDANNDGNLEIAFLSDNRVYCIQHKLGQARIYAKEQTLSIAPPGVVDIDDDGKKEMILSTKSGDVFCLHGETWKEMWRYRIGECAWNIPAIGNILGDSKPEILVHIGRNVVALSLEGKELWRFQTEEGKSRYTPLFVDADRDGKLDVIVATSQKGLVYCLKGDTGKLIWKGDLMKCTMRPKIADVDGDGIQEFIACGSAVYQDGLGRVWCLKTKDGSIKWESKIPRWAEGGTDLSIQDINGDGVAEIFVCQVAGNVSCIEGKAGRAYWHRRLEGSDVRSTPAVGDFNGDGKWEVIVATGNDDIYCLDAQTGAVLWQNCVVQDSDTVFDMDMGGGVTEIIDVKRDLNKDGISDFMMLNSRYTFSLFSGKDGKWLAHSHVFGIFPQTNPSLFLMSDINNDDRPDFIFVDATSRLVCIYDIMGYLEKMLVQPQIFETRYIVPSFYEMAFLNRLLAFRNYDCLEHEITMHKPKGSISKRYFYLYQAICQIARGRDPNKSLKECEILLPELQDIAFLKALYALNQGNRKDATPLLESLMQNSILDFHALYQKYQYLLTLEGKTAFRELLPLLIQKTRCNLPLYNAYQYALFVQKKKEADYFLELFVRYSCPETPEYKKMRDLYVAKVLASLGNLRSIYIYHKAFYILRHALEVIPGDLVLLQKRAAYYADGNIPEKALEDIERLIALDPKNLTWRLANVALSLHLGKTTHIPEILDDLQKEPHFSRHEYAYLIHVLKNIAVGNYQQADAELQQRVNQKRPSEDDVWIFSIIARLGQ